MTTQSRQTAVMLCLASAAGLGHSDRGDDRGRFPTQYPVSYERVAVVSPHTISAELRVTDPCPFGRLPGWDPDSNSFGKDCPCFGEYVECGVCHVLALARKESMRDALTVKKGELTWDDIALSAGLDVKTLLRRNGIPFVFSSKNKPPSEGFHVSINSLPVVAPMCMCPEGHAVADGTADLECHVEIGSQNIGRVCTTETDHDAGFENPCTMEPPADFCTDDSGTCPLAARSAGSVTTDDANDAWELSVADLVSSGKASITIDLIGESDIEEAFFTLGRGSALPTRIDLLVSASHNNKFIKVAEFADDCSLASLPCGEISRAGGSVDLSRSSVRATFARLQVYSNGIDLSSADSLPLRIPEFSLVGRCACNGHAETCGIKTLPTFDNGVIISSGLECDCLHNTIGTQCTECAPFHHALPWKPGEDGVGKDNACQKCNCNGHVTDESASDSCVLKGDEGGYTCKCEHNTVGDHCDRCAPGYVENLEVSIDSVDRCILCVCGPGAAVVDGSDNLYQCTTNEGGNTCICKPDALGVAGRGCDVCAAGFYGFTAMGCSPCDCKGRWGVNPNYEFTCSETGACTCRSGIEGDRCDICSGETDRRGDECFPCNEGQYYDGTRLQTTRCVSCNAACSGCDGAGDTRCRSCRFGQVIDDDGVTIARCLQESEKCASSHFNDGSETYPVCKRCHSACQTCFGPEQRQCLTCTAGHTLDITLGALLDPLCDCTEAAEAADPDKCPTERCRMCTPGTSCPSGQYSLIGEMKCYSCSSSCGFNTDETSITCTGPKAIEGLGGCNKCKEFVSLNSATGENDCTDQCPTGQFKVYSSSRPRCIDCSEKCSEGRCATDSMTQLVELNKVDLESKGLFADMESGWSDSEQREMSAAFCTPAATACAAPFSFDTTKTKVSTTVLAKQTGNTAVSVALEVPSGTCVNTCNKLTYSTIEDSSEVCRACDVTCHGGCSGPGSHQCDACITSGFSWVAPVDQDGGIFCFEKCPPSAEDVANVNAIIYKNRPEDRRAGYGAGTGGWYRDQDQCKQCYYDVLAREGCDARNFPDTPACSVAAGTDPSLDDCRASCPVVGLNFYCGICSSLCSNGCSGPFSDQCLFDGITQRYCASGAVWLADRTRCAATCPVGYMRAQGISNDETCQVCQSSCTAFENSNGCCTGTGSGTCGFLTGTDVCEVCDPACAGNGCIGPTARDCTGPCPLEKFNSPGECVLRCEDDQFIEQFADGGKCRKCDPACKSCTGPSNNECSTCSPSHIMNLDLHVCTSASLPWDGSKLCLNEQVHAYFTKDCAVEGDIYNPTEDSCVVMPPVPLEATQPALFSTNELAARGFNIPPSDGLSLHLCASCKAKDGVFASHLPYWFDVRLDKCVPCSEECAGSCSGGGADSCELIDAGSFGVGTIKKRCVGVAIPTPGVGIVCGKTCAVGQYPGNPHPITGEVTCETCNALCSDAGCNGPSGRGCFSCIETAWILEMDEGHSCISDCNSIPGLFGDTGIESTRVCQKCDALCTSCRGPAASDCLACIDTAYRVGNTCTTVCPSNMYPDVNRECRPCYKACNTPGIGGPAQCRGPLQSDCNAGRCSGNALQLEDPFNPLLTECVTKCPLGMFELSTGGLRRCKVCSEKCRECAGTALECSNRAPVPPYIDQTGVTGIATLTFGSPVDLNAEEALSFAFKKALVAAADAQRFTAGRFDVYNVQRLSNPNLMQIEFVVITDKNDAAQAQAFVASVDRSPSQSSSVSAQLVVAASGTLAEALQDFVIDDSDGDITIIPYSSPCNAAAGYTMFDGSCVTRVSCVNCYIDEDTNVMTKCDPKCDRCSGPGLMYPSSCSQCSGLVSANGKVCVDDCSVGEFVDGDRCRTCDEQCGADGCFNNGPDSCNSCKSFKSGTMCVSSCAADEVIFGNECKMKCPSTTEAPTYLSSGNICKRCLNGCATCADGTGFCTSCMANFFDTTNVNGELGCVETCPAKSFPVASLSGPGTCERCSIECFASCSSASNSSCIGVLVPYGSTQILRKCAGAVDKETGLCVSKCVAGQYYDTPGVPSVLDERYGGYACKECQSGFSCTDGVVQNPCPFHSYTANKGAVKCIPCPLNAYCHFDWEKGAKDSFECNEGFALKTNPETQLPECIGSIESAKEVTTDTSTHLLIGVVAGCAALLAVAGAYVAVQKSANKAELSLPVSSQTPMPTFGYGPPVSPGGDGMAMSYPSPLSIFGNTQAETHM